jgi:hypothetical protein
MGTTVNNVAWDQMKALRFKASAVAASEFPDLNAFALVLAEEETRGPRIEAQTMLVDDGDDFGAYSISTDTGATHYDALSSWDVSDGRLELHFNEEAREVFGVDSVIISFDTRHTTLVREGMTRVVAGPPK